MIGEKCSFDLTSLTRSIIRSSAALGIGIIIDLRTDHQYHWSTSSSILTKIAFLELVVPRSSHVESQRVIGRCRGNAASSPRNAYAKDRKPNLLYILADDHAGYVMGSDGNKRASHQI